jgi:cytochrome P450
MSASLFGGSFNLVETDNQTVKNMFVTRLKWAAINHTIPFAKYIPFMPSDGSKEMDAFFDNIIAKRRRDIEEKGVLKRDLFQMLLELNEANPVEFSEEHLKGSMMLFMCVG